MGTQGCLRLHRALLADTLERTADLQADPHLFLGDCSSTQRDEFAAELGTAGVRWALRMQEGDSLGERLHNAYRSLAAAHGRVVFLGSDSPTLPRRWIVQAFTALARLPFVVGPSQDGGYYLIGLGQDRPQIFRGIDWGTERVLEQTLQRLQPGEFQRLPVWYDVDVPADLKRLKAELESWPAGRGGFPRRTSEYLSSLRWSQE